MVILSNKMNEKEGTMQCEGLEESVDSTEPTSAGTMTFPDCSESPATKLTPQITSDEDITSQELKTEFDEINLEDDIEKVEESSSESSVTNGESTVSSSKFPISKEISPLNILSEQNSNESIKSWLQRISEMQNEIQKKINSEHSSGQSNHFTNESKSQSSVMTSSSNTTISNPSRVVKYQDLPYMGEMTLDNSKPRRGRKPKKADICHLIYKNYGTIFPGTPNPKSYLEKDAAKKIFTEKDFQLEHSNKSDVQNRIISSLLEKRLTQDYKRRSGSWNLDAKSASDAQEGASGSSEPLNLCIRDLNHLKIRFLKKQDNTYTSEIKSEPLSDEEHETVRKMNSSPRAQQKTEAGFTPVTPGTPDTLCSSPESPQTPENGAGPGGYIYWPNAGVFIHPMALQQQLMYYQRLAANNNYTLPSISPKPSPTKSNGDQNHHPQELRKIVPKVRPKRSDSSENSTENNGRETKPKRNASSNVDKTPAKRKRSAIFIPPIPAENTANPATEVSICKFKFTGGAKPSLQEKKMLSVDSGGNFRYYSGTGDKSMRGYEFFPRETLQQQITHSQGSSTGAFLQASGEKIYPLPPPDFNTTKLNTDFLLTPDIAPSALNLQDMTTKQKKRKTKKSMQREKLEQTFKEKGFLIQTQQLESAEGATYCKFRQLRKFTRYLFRSWKDYLPGNVRELQEGDKGENDDLTEHDFENLSRHSSSDNMTTTNIS